MEETKKVENHLTSVMEENAPMFGEVLNEAEMENG